MNNPGFVQLPSGDLWIPPTRDENNNIIPRKDNVDLGPMPVARQMTPDVAAMLMADLERQRNELAKAQAAASGA